MNQGVGKEDRLREEAWKPKSRKYERNEHALDGKRFGKTMDVQENGTALVSL